MRYPKMSSTEVYRVTIPELSGGLNCREASSVINDNQLADAKNMWWQNSVLTTRPSVVCSNSSVFTDNSPITFRYTDIYKTENGLKYRVIAAIQFTQNNYMKVSLHYISDDGQLMPYPNESNTVCNLQRKNCSIFGFNAFESSSGSYIFLGFTSDSGDEKLIVKIDSDGTMSTLSDDELYAPLVLTNGNAIVTHTYECNGDFYEGYNLITDRYRAVYSTYNVNNKLTDNYGKLRHEMTYNLPEIPKIGSEIIVKHTLKDGTLAEHKITVTSNHEFITEPEFNPVDLLKVEIFGARIMFFGEESNYSPKNIYEESYVKNNLEIIATHSHEANWKKIFNMNFCTWFGGTADGINGGTRLFLAGNTDEPNLMCWSDLNNPLYFSENSYAYVGNSANAITTFGKQSDMLVIFKENEIYSTTYIQGQAALGDDLTSSNIMDITQSMAYFPITQIHSGIGCDCPNTVQLCQNRLVWATTLGKIYTLVTSSQYSETNIYELSAMIEKKLKDVGPDGMRKSWGVDCFNSYILFTDNRAFVLDYGSYGFSRVYSYSDSDKAQKNICWYYWEMPENIKSAHTLGSAIGLVLSDKIAIMREDTGYDIIIKDGYKTQKPIDCMVKTKDFDFSNPHRFKKILQVYLGMNSSSGQDIRVSFSDSGNELAENIIQPAELLHEISRITPMLPQINSIGLKIECSGGLSIYNMALYYKLLGGVK